MIKAKKQRILSELDELEVLEEENNLSNEQLALRIDLQIQLFDIYDEEELFWNKNSSEQWLLHGDNNTCYFHRIANGRRRKHIIFRLQDGDNEISGTDLLVKHATEYYKGLFSNDNKCNLFLRDNIWSENQKLTREEAIALDRRFEESEIREVIFSMACNKAAGPDGFPVEFFQKCWDFIKQDIMNMFHAFHDNKIDLSRINYGSISLLPKWSDANVIQKYRLICLLPTLLKMITKAMTLRLVTDMDKLIDSCQNAFIKGRNIMDGIVSLHEVLHESRLRRKQGLILKLDFEKAYDKVNWVFLFKCLCARGFSERWCSWFKSVVMGGTLSVKVNGKEGPYFGSFKGVRQGDPLSPFLFNVAADCLATMFREAQTNNMFVGLASNVVDGGIALLQYADDTIIMVEEDVEQIRM